MRTSLAARSAGALLLLAAPTFATLVPGGAGSRLRDCVSVLDAPGANAPAPPRPPTRIDCVDGDPTCDADGTRDAHCVFTLRVCVNSTALPDCTPERADVLTVVHALDDGDPRFDTDFQSLQSRAGLLGFPGNTTLDDCTLPTSIGVRLVPPAPAAGHGEPGARWSASRPAGGRAAG